MLFLMMYFNSSGCSRPIYGTATCFSPKKRVLLGLTSECPLTPVQLFEIHLLRYVSKKFFFPKNFSKIFEKLLENFSIYSSNFVIFHYSSTNDCSEKNILEIITKITKTLFAVPYMGRLHPEG